MWIRMYIIYMIYLIYTIYMIYIIYMMICYDACCLRIVPFFLPNDTGTPRVRADSSVDTHSCVFSTISPQ